MKPTINAFLSFFSLHSAPLILATGLCLAVSACQNTPYQRPAITIPTTWQQPTPHNTQAHITNWWQHFNDPHLNALLTMVRQRNPDVASALINVRKAQLAAGLATSKTRPTITGTFAGSTARATDQSSAWEKSYTGNLSTQYEVDLWGRLDAQQRAATQKFIASHYDQQSALLLSDSTTAKLYWTIASLKSQMALANANLADAKQIVTLTETRYQSGAVAEQDTVQARQALLNQVIAQRNIKTDLQTQYNALALLLDEPASQSPPAIPALGQHPTLPAIEVGLPSTLIARRPDIMAQEAHLRAALANIDEQRAAFFPAFSLTGTLGTSSTALGSILQNPVATLGAGITLPFLQWNQQRLQLKVSQADYELAVISFRKTLYSAYQEVNNALNQRTQLRDNATQQQALLRVSQRYETIAKNRYLAGEDDLQNWLNAAQSRRQAEKDLLSLRLAQLENLADLYKALGGEPTTQ